MAETPHLTDRALLALDAIVTFGEAVPCRYSHGRGWLVAGCGHVFGHATIDRLLANGVASRERTGTVLRIVPTAIARRRLRELRGNKRRPELARRTAPRPLSLPQQGNSPPTSDVSDVGHSERGSREHPTSDGALASGSQTEEGLV